VRRTKAAAGRFKGAAVALKQLLARRMPTLRDRWSMWWMIVKSPGFVSGPRGFQAYCQLVLSRSKAPRSIVRISLRPLNGHSILARTGTSDAQVIYDTFSGQYHLPPTNIPRLAQILDLGSNIGTTIAHMAVVFPEAQILGVELDGENAELCQQNIAPWSDRCTVLHAAIWSTDGTVRYRLEPRREYGARVVTGTPDLQSVTAISLNSIVARLGRNVDYLKMDIEGVEGEILGKNNEWAEQVRVIAVEVHPPYSVESCLRDLRALNFEATPMPNHWAGVVGIRRSPHTELGR